MQQPLMQRRYPVPQRSQRTAVVYNFISRRESALPIDLCRHDAPDLGLVIVVSEHRTLQLYRLRHIDDDDNIAEVTLTGFQQKR